MGAIRERDSPPAGFTLRPARTEDIPDIIALMDAFDASFGHEVMSYDPADIERDWRDLDIERDTWVIHAPTGALAAYANVNDEGQGQLATDGYVHPAWRSHGLGALILRLSEARAREKMHAAPAGARVALINNVLVEDEDARALLKQAGYALVRVFWRMRIALSEPPLAPEWPAGVRLRLYDPDRDERPLYEMVETAFGDHWGHTPTTFDEWQANAENSFDPSLWFVVEDDAGQIVSAAICRERPEQGWIRTVATARAWRKRGLGRALLLHAFGAFWSRGQRVIGLGVDSQSLTGAAHLYESVGMEPEMRIATYEKELRPGENLVVRELAE